MFSFFFFLAVGVWLVLFGLVLFGCIKGWLVYIQNI